MAEQTLTVFPEQLAEMSVSQLANLTHAQKCEVDVNLTQASTWLKQARTNVELARVNLERSKTLVAQGIVSHQDLDDKQALFDAATLRQAVRNRRHRLSLGAAKGKSPGKAAGRNIDRGWTREDLYSRARTR